MAISVLQQNKGDFTSSSSSFSLAFSSGISAGSVIVVFGSFPNSVTGVTLSDGHGDTPTDSGNGLYNGTSIGSWSFLQAFLAPTTGAKTITATYSGGTPGYGDLFIYEVAGLTSPKFDKVPAVNSGDVATATSNATGTLSAANEIAFGLGITSLNFTSGEAGWTQQIAPDTGDLGQYIVVSSTASLTSTGSDNNGNWDMWIATLMSGSGGNTYTLSCGEGSFSFTGEALTENVGRTLSLGLGTFSFTGKALTTSAARLMSLAAGTFSFTGMAITFSSVVSYTLSLAAGAFTFTGEAITANAGRQMSLIGGVFSFTGGTLSVGIGRVLALGAGSFTFTGKAITANISRIMNLAAGSFVFTGAAMTFAVALSLLAQAGSFAFTGGAAFMTYVPFGSKVISYGKKFFASMGTLMGNYGDPPS